MTGISTLGSFQAQSTRITNLQVQLDRLSNQFSTQKLATDFAGLGNDVIRSQRARADLRELEIFQRNVDLGTLRIDLQSNALENIETQSEIALDAINIEVRRGQIDLSRIKDTADTALGIVRDLLNERDAENFLFAGTDVLTQPLNDTGTLETAIGNLLNDWENEVLSTDELLAALRERDSSVNPLAVTDTQVGYSTTLSEAKGLSIRADSNIEVDTTVKADEDQFRNILVALEVLRQLPQEANGNGIDFDRVPDAIQDTNVVVTSTQTLPADIFTAAPLAGAGGQGAGPYEIQFVIDDPVNGPQGLTIDLDLLDNDAVGPPTPDTPDVNGIIALINEAVTANPNLTSTEFEATLDGSGRLEITSSFDFTIDATATGPTNPAPAGILAFLGLDQDGGAADIASFVTTTGDAETTGDEQREFFNLVEALASDIQTNLEGVSRSRLNLLDSLAIVDRVNDDIAGERVALLNLIGQVEDIDINEVGVQLQQIQFQLQASYQITSSISQLSLTNFLNL